MTFDVGIGKCRSVQSDSVDVWVDGSIVRRLAPETKWQRDGISVLQWLRQRLAALPVLILTARDGVDDRVQGLNAGADDYLTKPFNMAELLARLQAMLRRARLPAFGGSLEVQGAANAKLRLDPMRPLGWLGDEPMDLTHREWSLLSLLVNNLGQVVAREDVLEEIKRLSLKGLLIVQAAGDVIRISWKKIDMEALCDVLNQS